MLAFNHLMAGSIIATMVPAPLVPIVAFASHFVLDLFPHAHGEEPPYSRFLKTQIAIDAVLSVFVVGLIFWLFPTNWPLIMMGAFFGLLPDFLWIFWKRGPKWLDKFLDWAHWIQWGERPYGWIFDAYYGLIMVILLTQFIA